MADDVEQSILVRILANIDGVLSGMKGASAAVAESTEAMNASFESVTATITKLKAPFLALTSIIAGGEVFHEAVKATNDWSYSSILLARTLGTTAEEASVLKVALDDIFVSTESYAHAVQMMTRNIAAGGKGFERLGIDTKDAKGHLKASGELMTEVLEKLNTLKAGTDRNVAGVAIFGRSWGEAQKLLALTSEKMEEARTKAERLNLIVGEDAVEANLRYKLAMQDAHDTTEGLRIAIGTQLLPILSALSEWMAEEGPGAIEVVSNVMKGFVQVIYTLQYALNQVWNLLVGIVSMAADVGTTVGAFFMNLARGDVSGALEAIKGGIGDVKETWKTTLDTMGSDTDALVKKTNDLWNPSKKASKVERPGADNFDPDKGTDKILQQMKEELEEKKNLEENWFTWNATRELAFWQEKLALVDKGTKEYVAVLSEVNKLRKEVQKEANDQEIERLKTELDAAVNNGEARIAIAVRIAEEQKRVHGVASKEYLAAMRDVAKEEKKLEDERRALVEDRQKYDEKVALERVASAEEEVAQMRELGELTAVQELAALQALEDRKYRIRHDSLVAQLQDEKLTALQRQQLLEELDLLEASHAKASAALVTKSLKDQLAEAKTLFAPLTSAWDSALAGMLAGTKSFTSSLRDLWRGLGQVVDQAIAQMLSAWIGAEAKKLALYISNKLQALAVHNSTTAAAAATTAAGATAEVGSEAAVAGAGAAASAAAIPGIGWMIAIPAALAVIGGVMAMKGTIASAAGGWGNIPNDQLAAVHKNEMILPAPIADSVRAMADNGGGGGEIHVHAMDAASFLQFAKTNKKVFATVVRDLVRNGALSMG